MSCPSNRGFGQRAISPAATTPGAATHSSSHTTPLSIVSPDPSSHAVSGTTPMPTSTTSASTAVPSPSRTRSTRSSPSIASTCTPVRRSTPWSRCIAAITAPSSGPNPRTIGCGSASSTVTSSPRPRHVAATSAPMNPAPITTTFGPASSRARSASASSSVRRVNTTVELRLIRKTTRRGARRDHQGVVLDAALVGECECTRLEIERDRTRPSIQSASRSSTPWRRNTMSAASRCPRADPSTAAGGRTASATLRRSRRSGRRNPHDGGSPSRAAPRATYRRPRPCARERGLSRRSRSLASDSRAGFLDQRASRLGRLLLEDVQEVVVSHFEDLGCDPHAHRVALALVEVDDDSHLWPPEFPRAPADATNWPVT